MVLWVGIVLSPKETMATATTKAAPLISRKRSADVIYVITRVPTVFVAQTHTNTPNIPNLTSTDLKTELVDVQIFYK